MLTVNTKSCRVTTKSLSLKILFQITEGDKREIWPIKTKKTLRITELITHLEGVVAHLTSFWRA